jgi:WD40 repeat protein/pyruvate/2-oxoglutarate dehydrogenase complex dihydrolipoamide acyltransferase (E2) component
MTQSPFKFLDSYTKEDRDIFFGREAEVGDLYTKTFQGRVLLLYGASGTGKSSLISCGLANRFQDSDWLPINVRRGVNINDSFRQQLSRYMLTPITSKGEISIGKLIKSVYLDHFKPIFIVFDQFEELFIFGDRGEWMKFVATIREILDAELQLRFIFIIRGEYLEHLTDFEPVIPEIFKNRMRIEKMTRTNALNCVKGPCQSAGITVEEGFAENLLNKLSPNKAEIELTYLQVFLDRIFTKARERAPNGKVTFSNAVLNELGNIGDVLAQFLDEQIASIPESEQALALLKAFVSSDATKKQVSAQQALNFVNTIGHPLDGREVNKLIQELVSRRILKDKDEAGRYELRHDSIAAKIYEKITSYERDLIEVNQFVAYAFIEHSKRGFMLNESDLAYIAPFEGKLILSHEVQEFIAKCRQVIRRQNRSRKQFYIITGVISFLLITSVMGLIYSQRQKAAADESANLAKEQSDEALKQKAEAETQKKFAEEKSREASQQTEIALAQKREADRQRAIANSLQLNAEEGRIEAVAQKSNADAARQQAEKFAQLADNNLKVATSETKKAERYRMLAIAQVMGAKAVQLQDTTQKVLVAMQAFHFNKRYAGYEYQPDIYNGLYSAFEQVSGDNFNSVSVHEGAVKGVVVLSMNSLISIGSDGNIKKTMLDVNPPVASLVDSYPHVLQSLAINPSKDRLAVGTEDGTLLIYDVLTMKRISEAKGHTGAIWTLTYDGAGNLYSGGNDGVIRKWTVGKEPVVLNDAASAVNAISFSTTLNSVAAGLSNGRVILVGASSGTNTREISRESMPVTQLRFSGKGNLLAVGKEDGSIVIRDLADSEIVESLNGHSAMVSDLQFSVDDTFLLSASYDGTSMLWNLKSISQRQVVFADHGGWVLQAIFSEDGQNVWSGDALGVLRYFPLSMEYYANELCSRVRRSMTPKEWTNFVGDSDIPYETTCAK